MSDTLERMWKLVWPIWVHYANIHLQWMRKTKHRIKTANLQVHILSPDVMKYTAKILTSQPVF